MSRAVKGQIRKSGGIEKAFVVSMCLEEWFWIPDIFAKNHRHVSKNSHRSHYFPFLHCSVLVKLDA